MTQQQALPFPSPNAEPFKQWMAQVAAQRKMESHYSLALLPRRFASLRGGTTKQSM